MIAPPTFHDSQGRDWTIKLSGELIENVLTATQVDLVPDDHDYIPVVNLVASHRKLGAVLWECVKRQAESHEVDRSAFIEALDGPAYLKGWEALVDAIHFFIRSLSAKRADQFLAVVEAGMKVMEAEAETAVEIINSQTTDEALKEAVGKIKAQMQSELAQELASSAENLVPLSASTRGRFRSAS